MTEKRFTVETSENQLIIVDNEGPDDYYHLGCDERDVKGVCKMLNDLNKDNQEEIQAFKNQSKELAQLIKTLFKENEELKQDNEFLKKALFYLWDCAIGVTSSRIDEELNELSQLLYDCNYNEASSKHNIEYEEIVNTLNKDKKLKLEVLL